MRSRTHVLAVTPASSAAGTRNRASSVTPTDSFSNAPKIADAQAKNFPISAAPTPVSAVVRPLHRISNISVAPPLPTGVQAKLTVSQPDDKYELEADRVADAVMRMPEPAAVARPEDDEDKPKANIQTKSISGGITPLVYRQSAPGDAEAEGRENDTDQEEEVQAKALVRRQPVHYEEQKLGPINETETAHVKRTQTKKPSVSTALQDQIHTVRGGSQALPDAARTYFEPRFGHDFSHVRIHSDGNAANLAKGVNAQAFTRGQDIFFGAGRYQPHSDPGRKLIAHELVHTIQQGHANLLPSDGISVLRQTEPSWGRARVGRGQSESGRAPLALSSISGAQRQVLRKVEASGGAVSDVEFSEVGDTQEALIEWILAHMRRDPIDQSGKLSERLATLAPEAQQSVMAKVRARRSTQNLLLFTGKSNEEAPKIPEAGRFLGERLPSPEEGPVLGGGSPRTSDVAHAGAASPEEAAVPVHEADAASVESLPKKRLLRQAEEISAGGIAPDKSEQTKPSEAAVSSDPEALGALKSKTGVPVNGSGAMAPAAITAKDPDGILNQLADVAPSNAFSAFAQAEGASVTALEKQRDDLQETLPEFPAPTGLPEAKAEVSTKQPSKPRVAPPDKLKGEKTGREGNLYSTKAPEAPPLRPVPTILAGGADKVAPEANSLLARSASNALESVSMDTTQITLDAGPRPSVDLTGEGDPRQMGAFRGQSDIEITNGKAEASKEIHRDHGENGILPAPTGKTLKASKPLSASLPPKAVPGKLPALVPEIAQGIDVSLGPTLRQRVVEKRDEYATGKSQFDTDVSDTRANADEDVANLKDEARDNQLAKRINTKAEVQGHKRAWQEDLDKIDKDYREKAENATIAEGGKISDEKRKAEGKADAHLADAEKQAIAKKREAERDEQKEKQKAKKESGGFWGWVKDKASALIDALKKAVNFIYDNLRKAVKGIFELAKKLVQGVIELARSVIVGLIKGFGALLKGLVKVVFAAFPEIAAKINGKIDAAVNKAVKVVNTIADGLKKAVAAVLDFLANTLDKLLGLVQSLYNAAFTVIGMLIRGEFAELMERIGNLVDAAKQMPSHLEGSVWEQLLGVDISKPMPGEEGYVAPEAGAEATSEQSDVSGDVSGLSDADVAAEPVLSEEADPELSAELLLAEGSEPVLGERTGEQYSLAAILADFAPSASAVARSMPEAPVVTSAPARTRSERAALVWQQLKIFMGKWLADNWGKLLLAIIGALVGIIALTIFTGGAILAALPIIMKIVTAVFIGIAIMKALGYLETYLSDGWAKKIWSAAKALGNALAVGIVELAMALGFRVVGAAVKGTAKAVAGVTRVAARGIATGARAAASGLKKLLKSGAALVSKGGSILIRRGKLIFNGLKRGFLKGIKKAKDLVDRLFSKFSIRRIVAIRRGNIVYIYGETNPRFLIATIKGVEFELNRRGSVKTSKARLEKQFPTSKVTKIRADAPHAAKGNPKLGSDPSSPQFGTHTVSKHGPGATQTETLKKLAQMEKVPQGQFRSADDILKAEKLTPIKRGTHIVEVAGDVILPNGKVVSTRYTVVVRLADGSVKTAFPARARDIALFVGRNI